MSNTYTLSFELTLPQWVYPYLDRLFNVFKWQVRKTINSIWNEEYFQKLKEKTSAMSVLKKDIPKPPHIPSRVHRNILELSGQIVRSNIQRKQIYDFIIEKPCRVIWSEYKIAEELQTSPLFVENIQRQVIRVLKKYKQKKDYLEVINPIFNGNVVITFADDSIEKGQFRRLKLTSNFLEFEIKIPNGNSWQWVKLKKLIPDRLKKSLLKAKRVASPLIKKVNLKSGYSIYRLVISLEFETKDLKENNLRTFSVDLSPSENRLGVGVIVYPEGYSKPVFFSAEKIIKKLERILKEISKLESKIDNISNQIHITTSKSHREKLKDRLRHLYTEQNLRWRKFKALRKQVLEVFTNLVIQHAKAYNCSFIAVERLKFSDFPQWKDSKMRRHFSQWFYSRFNERLKQKAIIFGIKVLSVNPYKTSRICHKCGKEKKPEMLQFSCECGVYDRDYNAAVNIGKRALQILVRGTKSKPYMGKDTPGRVPFPLVPAHQVLPYKFKAFLSLISLTKLISYLRIVETSYLRLKNLNRWTGSDKYG